MTESFLTVDIIVIIVLVVVLIIIGVCAFFAHFYWTKIGVSEIWNTAKWSSMRSSFYRTVRGFSRPGSAASNVERPFSAASVFSETSEIDGTLPAPLRQKNTNHEATMNDIDVSPSHNQPSKTASGQSNVRSNPHNQVRPVTTVSYNNSIRLTPSSNPKSATNSIQPYRTPKNDDADVVIHTQRL